MTGNRFHHRRGRVMVDEIEVAAVNVLVVEHADGTMTGWLPLNPASAVPEPARIVTIGGLQVDRGRHEIHLDGELIPMGRKQFALLNLLAETPGTLVTLNALITEVWGAEHCDPSGVSVLNQYLRRLRLLLASAVEIVNVRGVGYRLDPLETT